jgi:RNA polymerase sigma-70 factor (ECF subfamily)
MREAEAIARLKRGDISGLEGLVAVYQVQAVRAAYLVTRDLGLAEDVVQSAFLRVYERIGQYDTSRPFGPWFLKSVINAAIKVSTRGRHASLDELSPLEALEGTLLRSYSEGVDLNSLAVEAETNDAIWEALGKLPPQQRAVLVLRYYLGLGEAEMSARLNVPAGTVKSRLHTARKQLRALLPSWLVPPSSGEESNNKHASYL